MKVLILTYYWPPAGGSGVQRWLKFVKYFRDFGIEPVIYTVKNPNYPIMDKSLLKDIPEGVEVLREPIWEPNNIRGKNKNTSAGFLSSKPSLMGKVLQYIRANYFIPDARKFWIKPSVKFLTKYLNSSDIDIVISTGPPHSLHLIANQLKQQTGIKWISDFRDPWTDIDYFHQLPLRAKSQKKHQDLEREVLKTSDAVIVVGETMKQNYLALNSNIHVVTNGFDSDILTENKKLDLKFTMTHIGLMNDDRNPLILWESLRELSKEVKNFSTDLQIKLIGRVSEKCLNDIHMNKLASNLKKIDYVSHNKVQEYQQSSQVLILAINDVPSAKGIITGKIFEYLIAKRPIFAIGPVDGDLSEIIKQTNSGVIVDFKDKVSMKATILEYYKLYKEGKLCVDSHQIEQYHRRSLTERMSQIIKSVS